MKRSRSGNRFSASTTFRSMSRKSPASAGIFTPPPSSMSL